MICKYWRKKMKKGVRVPVTILSWVITFQYPVPWVDKEYIINPSLSAIEPANCLWVKKKNGTTDIFIINHKLLSVLFCLFVSP